MMWFCNLFMERSLCHRHFVANGCVFSSLYCFFIVLQFCIFKSLGYITSILWCRSQARVSLDGCDRRDVQFYAVVKSLVSLFSWYASQWT